MEHSITDWVSAASGDRITFRQAVHTVLYGISTSEFLQPKMIMKGGMLLGIRYQSSRFTEDIDFSTSLKLSDFEDVDEFKKEFIDELNEALQVAQAELPYGVKCKVQSLKVQPRNSQEDSFPSFNLKIGYAPISDDALISRLERGQSPKTIKIDYSFNEYTHKVEDLAVESEDDPVQAYGFSDLIAEKYRSMIQQIVRNRSRRQDVYDLNYLLNNVDEVSSAEKMNILVSLISKSDGRLDSKELYREALDNEEIKARSQANYHTLHEDIEGELPDFDTSYEFVNSFFKSLPWEHLSR